MIHCLQHPGEAAVMGHPPWPFFIRPIHLLLMHATPSTYLYLMERSHLMRLKILAMKRVTNWYLLFLNQSIC